MCIVHDGIWGGRGVCLESFWMGHWCSVLMVGAGDHRCVGESVTLGYLERIIHSVLRLQTSEDGVDTGVQAVISVCPSGFMLELRRCVSCLSTPGPSQLGPETLRRVIGQKVLSAG